MPDSMPGSNDSPSNWTTLETEHRELANKQKLLEICQSKLQVEHHWLCDRIEHARRNLEILIKLKLSGTGLANGLANDEDLQKITATNLSVLNEVSKIGNQSGENNANRM